MPALSIRSRRTIAALIAILVLACAGCGSSATRTTSSPAAAADQARWLLGAAEHLPIPAAPVRAHFARSFLAQVTPAALNQALAQAAGLLSGSGRVRFAQVSANRPGRFVATVTRGSAAAQLTLTLAVDGHGLIDLLTIKPKAAAPVAADWRAIDTAARSVAPDVHMLVARLSANGCQTIDGIGAGAGAPLGSAFKLYVLDALGRAVAGHRLSWSDRLTITSALKSLPSGVLQNEPDGATVSVRDAVDKLISLSDNTAADVLINRLGRRAVETTLTQTGMARPGRDEPFLTPRELFILKLAQWPELARSYLTADAPQRRALLAGTVDRAPLPTAQDVAGWAAPRDIDSIEWFASPRDICRVYSSLTDLAARPGLSPLAGALQIADGGLGLDRTQWPQTWFKGGSEAGVLTLTYEATARSGQRYVVAVLASNPHALIDEVTAGPVLLSAIRSAFALAAKPSGAA
jgi:beta-lactamase class A